MFKYVLVVENLGFSDHQVYQVFHLDSPRLQSSITCLLLPLYKYINCKFSFAYRASSLFSSIKAQSFHLNTDQLITKFNSICEDMLDPLSCADHSDL